MKILAACLIFIGLLAYTTAQSYQGSNMVTGVQQTTPAFVETMSSVIIEWLSRAFEWAMEALDIKFRSVRFLSTLYTDDNLTLLKRFLNVGLRFGGWLYEAIPNSADEGNNRFLQFLFPELSFMNRGNNYEKDQILDDDEDDDDDDFDNNLKRDTAQQEYANQVSSLHSLINGKISTNNVNNNHNQLIY